MTILRKIAVSAATAAVAVSLAALPASAAVSFDSSTGTGFVGKGDVQLAFGWNNQALQQNVSGVTFTYEATDTYAATCTWTTGEGTRGEKTHNVDIPRSTSVNSTVAYESRKNSQQQITGFNLTGLGSSTVDGTIPMVGATCVAGPTGAGQDGIWTSVELTGSTGGLYVNYGGTAVALPNTPVA